MLGEDTGIWNSKFMQETFGLEPYDLGEVTHEFVKRSAGRVNGELIRKYVCNSGEMFDSAIAIVKEKGENSSAGSAGLVTLAGVNTDSNMNVLNMNGNPIKGLYVAGNTLGGLYGVGY